MEYQLADLAIGISAIPEPAYNSLVPGFTSDAAPPDAADINNYLGMLTTGRGFPMPDKEKHDDTGKIGRGREFPRTQRSGYVLPPTMEITDELNTDIGALLFRRALGGADALTVVEAGEVWQHRFLMLDTASASGRQLPSSSVVYALGGADFLYGGVVVDTFRIDQTGANVPTFTAGLVGSGLFRRIRDLSAAPAASGGFNVIARPSVPRPIDMNIMLGAETFMQFTDTDPATGNPRTISLTASNQRLLNFTATVANNHNTGARRPGDSRLDSTSTRKGWHVKRMLHGTRTVGAEMTIMLDDDMVEFDDANNDSIITSFIWRSQGHYIQATDGSLTTYQYTHEIEFPRCYYRGVRGNDENGDATLTVGIFPGEDTAIYGLLRARILNKRSTAIL